MNHIKSYTIFIMILSVVVFQGCTKKFEDYNTDRNKLTEEMLQHDNLKVNSFFAQMEKNVIPAGNDATNEVNQYQLSENLQGDIWSGFMGATNNWNSGRNNSNYSLIPAWTSTAFSNAFQGVMPAWKQVKEATIEVDSNNIALRAAYAMAQVIKVFAISRTSDMYGPLPYLDFGNGSVHTAYDSQEDIYRSFFVDLDKAMDVLHAFLLQSGGVSPDNDFDLVYGGDYSKWLKFANTLKLRLAIRVVYADDDLAKKNAEETITDGYGFIESQNDAALFHSNSLFTLLNPIEWIQDDYGDIRMGATMESLLKGYNDPRLPLLFNTVNGEYHGIRTGIDISNKSNYTNNFSTMKIESSDPLPWIKASESYFLRAEGALRGWNMGGDAEDYYEAGVKASFSSLNASGVAAYLNDETSIAAPYVDPVNNGNNVSAGSSDLSDITIKWDDGASDEEKLERIITQKWIALFPDGQEAWTEFRRTGYPKIFPVVKNYSQGKISTSEQIRRIPFPQNEYQTNSQGVSQGIQELGGLDNGGTKLWWDQK